MEKLMKAHGNWVEKDRFWDREPEIRLFTQLLDEGAHILLTAQRRMGKTSLMREVGRRIQERYLCIFVDLEKCEGSPDAVAELSTATIPYANLWEKTKNLFSNIFGRVEAIDIKDIAIKLRSGITAGDWKSKGDQLLAMIADYGKPIVIFMDEVPILVNRLLKGSDYKITEDRRREADMFMSWLRDNALRHKDKIRFVITGSIGLEPVLHQANLSSTLAGFKPFDLKPWSEDIAASCIQALANQYQIVFQPGVCDAMVKKLGCCIPHHVQMFFDHIHDESRLRNISEISFEFVNDVYEKNMFSSRGHAELSHFEERLKTVLGEEYFPLAIDLLTEAAVNGFLSPEVATMISKRYSFGSDHVLREIIGILEHDGYFLQKERYYRFVSNLLKDWWKARFAFTYRPAKTKR